MSASFPGGTSVTLLEVYDDAAPDGVIGGSPHMHLASAECYLVIGGTGALQTIDAAGFQQTPLAEGSVVWFTPGTIHRAINHGGLRVIVLMQNAGLPEAGDAVLTFPAQIVADSEAYRAAAVLTARATEAERARDAARRRDLAVEGFAAIRDALLSGDRTPLEAFRRAAAALVADRAAAWDGIVRSGPLAQAELTIDAIASIATGTAPHLQRAEVFEARLPAPERGFGMCGRLSPYDVTR